MDTTDTASKEVQGMFGLIQLIYLKLSGLTPIKDFNIKNAAALYDVDKDVDKVLIAKGIIKNTSFVSNKPEYKWETPIKPNWKMAEALEEEMRVYAADKRVTDEEIPEEEPVEVEAEPAEKTQPSRPVSDNITNKSTAWTGDEYDYLKENMDETPIKEIAEHLGRTYDSVSQKTSMLRRGKVKVADRWYKGWSQSELAFLRDNMDTMNIDNMADKLGRTYAATSAQASLIRKGRTVVHNVNADKTPEVSKEVVVDEPMFGLSTEQMQFVRANMDIDAFKLSKALNISPEQIFELKEKIKQNGTGSPSPEAESTFDEMEVDRRSKIAKNLKVRPWTEEEDQFIADNTNKSNHWIGNEINRTPKAVEMRIYKLKIAGEREPQNQWTEEELQFIKDNYETLSDEKIADKLERTPRAVEGRRLLIGLTKHHVARRYSAVNHWTKEEDELLMDKWDTYSLKRLAKELDRTESAVKNRRHKLTTQEDSAPVTHKPKTRKVAKRVNEYSDEDIAFIKENYIDMSNHELSKHIDRSANSIAVKKSSLGLVRPSESANVSFWTKSDDAFLMDNWDKKSASWIAKQLGRSSSAVRNRRWKLNLPKKMPSNKDILETRSNNEEAAKNKEKMVALQEAAREDRLTEPDTKNFNLKISKRVVWGVVIGVVVIGSFFGREIVSYFLGLFN